MGQNYTNITQGFIDKLIYKLSKIIQEQHALVERDDEQEESIELLLEKVNLIEKNYEELIKSLAKGSYPLKLAKSIEITESLAPVKIVPVELTKSQLIKTYNEIPLLLSGYIIPVTLTADSYRSLNPKELILETTVKGNYWAIATLENKQYQYWLVPNCNLKLDIYKLKTINSLFQLTGNYESPSSEYMLQEPAILSLLPNNKQWKLLQPGILFFSENLKTTSPQIKGSQNEIHSSTLSTLQTTIDKLNKKLEHLENQANIFQTTYQKEREEWIVEKKVLNEQLQKAVVSQSQLSDFINQDNFAENFNINNNPQQNLSEADLAIVKNLKPFFHNMVDVVRRYHADHHASKEEAESIANYLIGGKLAKLSPGAI